jgi:tetratricopeptide (TPR) repeat protein
MSSEDHSPAMEEALELLRRGESVQAEKRMTQHVDQTARQFGPRSRQFAAAQFEFGSLLLYMGQFRQAADAIREACDINLPDDSQATRDRLTYLMNLGEVLEQIGELDQAEQVLREGLTAREQFYGREHPGYAFGLEPLAAVTLRIGRLDEALQMAEETIDNYWRDGHPRVASALALRAEILKTAELDTPPFDGLEELPDGILQDLAEATTQRLDDEKPQIGRAMLRDLVPLISGRLGEQHDAMIQILTAMANLDRSLGDAQSREQAIRRVIAAHDARHEAKQAISAKLGLALAQSEAGQTDEAIETYRHAVEGAKGLGDSQLHSQVLRNFGLYYAELDRLADAEQTLRLAVGAARKSREDEMIGRAEVALGIFLQHHGRADEAESLLAGAIQHLDSAHPDALCARSHLQAIESGSGCGCGDMRDALGDAFRQFVLQRIPQGLVKDVRVAIDEGQFDVHVEMAREPTPEEQELLDKTFQHAQEQFRRRLNEGPDY